MAGFIDNMVRRSLTEEPVVALPSKTFESETLNEIGIRFLSLRYLTNALISFKKAKQIVAHPDYSYNIAQVYVEAGLSRLALEELQSVPVAQRNKDFNELLIGLMKQYI